MDHKVTSFYSFFKKDMGKANELLSLIKKTTSRLNLKGMVLIAGEGINATVAGDNDAIDEFKKTVDKILMTSILYKDSYSSKPPFKRMKVRLKSEIITFDKNLKACGDKKLAPKQWHMILENKKENTMFVDARNWYETDLGTFRSSTVLGIDTFQEFTTVFEKLNVPSSKDVYIFCTGGVRCEKIAPVLKKKGHKVYQLDGGILNYLKEYPQGFFDGECFVFDHRVSVDNKLNNTKKYTLCPHCGQPAKDDYECVFCKKKTKVCKKCIKDFKNQTCSKNCAYHVQRQH